MNRLNVIGLLVAICYLTMPVFSQTTYYVDASKPDNSGAGTTWLSAKKDVQDAIDASSPGDQIWVKSGVYKPKNYPSTLIPVADSYPSGSPLLPLSDRDNMFLLKNNQKIYGGFAGTETSINERTDILGSNKTTFSGDVGTVGDSTDNCYHILVYLAPDNGAVAPTIDGIHFEGAYANSNYGQTILPGAAFGSAYDLGISKAFGGAIYIYLGNNGEVRNCSFTHNTAGNRGASIWFEGGFGTTRKLTVKNSFFYNNSSNSYGSGIATNYGENTFANNVFYGNKGTDGTAIFQFAGEAKIYSNTFVNNDCSQSVGTVYLHNNGDSAVFYNNLFYGNIAGYPIPSTTNMGVDQVRPGTFYTEFNPLYGFNLNYSWDVLFKNNSLQLAQSAYTTTSDFSTDLGAGATANLFQQAPSFLNINDLDGEDNQLGTADDGLILQSISSIVDAGDSTLVSLQVGSFDISGFDRVVGANINPGAYERTWTPCFTAVSSTVTACDSFAFNGITYASSGTYVDTIDAASCDTIVTLNLTIYNSSASSISIDTCQAFVFNSQLISATGVYTQTIPNANGCDSTITLNATISPLSNSISIDTCQAILLNNQLLSSSGTYTQTLTNAFGCDSILTIDFVLTPITGLITQTSCGPVTINGQVFSVSGIYTQNLMASNGCDSTLTLDLTIEALPNLTVSISNGSVFCENQEITLTATGASSLTWDNGIENGIAFFPAVGINLYTVTGIENGCTGTLQVPVNVGAIPSIEATVSDSSICELESVYFSGNGALIYNYLTPDFAYAEWFTPTQLGVTTYLMEGIGVNGCRDTVSISIELRDRPDAPSVSALTASTCYGHPLEPSVVSNPSSGIIEWFLDSNLSSSYEINNTLNEDELSIGTRSYFASNFDNDCYSPPTEVQITVHALPEVNAGSDFNAPAHETVTLTGTISNTDDYYWTNSLNNQIDSTLTTSFLSTNSVEYTLYAISLEGCVDSSSVVVTIDKPFVSSNYVSANGDGNNDSWQIQPLEKISGCVVRIFNTFGQIIFESDNYQNDWTGSDFPDGDYYFEISCEDDKTVGSITLIH